MDPEQETQDTATEETPETEDTGAGTLETEPTWEERLQAALQETDQAKEAATIHGAEAEALRAQLPTRWSAIASCFWHGTRTCRWRWCRAGAWPSWSRHTSAHRGWWSGCVDGHRSRRRRSACQRGRPPVEGRSWPA